MNLDKVRGSLNCTKEFIKEEINLKFEKKSSPIYYFTAEIFPELGGPHSSWLIQTFHSSQSFIDKLEELKIKDICMVDPRMHKGSIIEFSVTADFYEKKHSINSQEANAKKNLHNFAKDLYEFLLTDKNCADLDTPQYIKILKKLFNDALGGDFLPPNDIFGFELAWKEDRQATEFHEISTKSSWMNAISYSKEIALLKNIERTVSQIALAEKAKCKKFNIFSDDEYDDDGSGEAPHTKAPPSKTTHEYYDLDNYFDEDYFDSDDEDSIGDAKLDDYSGNGDDDSAVDAESDKLSNSNSDGVMHPDGLSFGEWNLHDEPITYESTAYEENHAHKTDFQLLLLPMLCCYYLINDI